MRTLILTAIPAEYQAVREFLKDLEEIETPDGTIFEKGIYSFPDKTLEIVIGQCGIGNINSAIYTERAIKTINPSLIIFVGIAGGIKDVKLGDVVVASKIYSYEGLKDDGGFNSRPDGYKCTYAIVQRALHEASTIKWGSTKSNLSYRVFVGPICVGEKVLGDKKSELYKFIRTHYNDSLAVEMESMGFMNAAHSNNCENFAVVRGISDLIEDKEETDNKGFQETACIHASEFAFALIKKVWKNIKPKIPKAIGMKLSFGEVLNPEDIEKVMQQIKKLTGDMNIELETVTYGSTNLYLKMSQETCENLKNLISSGILQKKIKLEPKSFKQYLFSKQEFPLSLEFNRFLPVTDSEFKHVYDYISVDFNNKVGEFWNYRQPDLKMSCIMFASYQTNFEFLQANRICIMDSSHYHKVRTKGHIDLKGLNFIRNEAIVNKWKDNWASLRSFKKDVKNDNIAIFKSSFHNLYETFYSMISNMIDIEDNAIVSSISKYESKFEDAEGYIIVSFDKHLSDFKKADRLIIDRLIKADNGDDE